GRAWSLKIADCRLKSHGFWIVDAKHSKLVDLGSKVLKFPGSKVLRFVSMKLAAIFLFLGALGWALPANAQTAGATLLVEARDAGGAALPGVLVTVTSQETGLERAG